MFNKLAIKVNKEKNLKLPKTSPKCSFLTEILINDLIWFLNWNIIFDLLVGHEKYSKQKIIQTKYNLKANNLIKIGHDMQKLKPTFDSTIIWIRILAYN